MRNASRQGSLFGGVPQADLLPHRQRAELVHERTMPKLVIAMVTSLVVAAGVIATGMWAVNLAGERLSAAEFQTEELNAAFAEHSDLHHTRQDIALISKQIAEIDGTQTEYMRVFDLVRGKLPADSTVVGFHAQPATGDAPVGMVCDPGAFTATITAETPSVAAASEFVRELASIEAGVCVEATALSSYSEDSSITSTIQLVLDDSIAGTLEREEQK